MLIYGEFGTIARISKYFGFLINGGYIASVTHAWETLLFMVGESNSRGWNFGARLSLLGVRLKLLARLYWILACGSYVFP